MNKESHTPARIAKGRWLPIRATIIAVTLFGWIGAVNASTIFLDDFSPTQQAGWDFTSPSSGFMGQLNNNVNVASVSLSQTFLSGPSDTVLGFDLLGFRSLDPINCCTDILTVRIDGISIFEMAAGFGITDLISTSVAYTESIIGSTNGSQNTYRYTLDIGSLSAGAHTFEWGYTPLQSFADEAWGLDNVFITGVLVPEPSILALLGLGVAGLGFARRRRTPA